MLSRLVAKSLVVAAEQQGTTRYSFLETIRQYAAEKLDSDEATLAHQRHAEFFTCLAEQAEPMLRGPEQHAWLERLAAEHDNLRAALRWSIDAAETETVLRLCGALWRFWWIRDDLEEGPRWQEQALALAGEASDLARANTLNGAGALARLRGEYDRATDLHTQSLVLMQQLGDPLRIAASFQSLASVAKDRGAFVQAKALYEQSLVLFREVGDDWGIALALNNLGTTLRNLRQYDHAAALCEEALAIRRAR
jgi:tetratricopeptide (TPR) repeat protein